MRQGIVTRREMLVGGSVAIGFAGTGCGSAQTVPGVGFSPLWPAHGKPALRGATLVQRRRDASIDGEGGLHEHHYLIPHYTLADFEALAATGANLVNLSVPGIWHTKPPYRRDQQMVDTLLTTLEACRVAGLYAVVGFRSGPGRSEFIFHRESAGSWFPESLIIDDIWRISEARQAWGAMCVDAAGLLAGRPEIAGLTPMVEPEPEMAGADMTVWPDMCWQIAPAIRNAAPDLPLLISPPGFANPAFLDAMGSPNINRVVWNVHDYGPFDYTHQARDGHRVDLPEDDRDELASTLGTLKQVGSGLPLFMGELGAVHWAPGREDYWRNRITALETAGVNWSAFRWRSSEVDYEAGDSDFTLGLPGVPQSVAAGWQLARLSRRPASGQAPEQGLRPRQSGGD